MQPIQFFGTAYPLHRVLQIGLSSLALPVLAWMIYRHHLQLSKYRQSCINGLKFMYMALVATCHLLAGVMSYFYFAESVYSDAFVHDFYAYIGKVD